MDEKKKVCSIIGCIALIICSFLLAIADVSLYANKYFSLIVTLLYGIATISFAIRVGIEIAHKEKRIFTILLLGVCLACICAWVVL